jgi:thymidylate synthase (FAD)
MKIIEPSIEILTPLSEEVFLGSIERAGRTCYKSEKAMTADSAREFCRKRIEEKHEAMLEHAPNISVRFICDRGVSHEIVRHRLFSFAQESTRYVNYKKKGIEFILPCWFSKDFGDWLIGQEEIKFGMPRLQDNSLSIKEMTWVNAMLFSEVHYIGLLSEDSEGVKWQAQQARSVLPNSLKTEIIVTGNVREWRHFFRLRTDWPAHPQMRQVAIMAYDTITAEIPVLFDDITPYRGI